MKNTPMKRKKYNKRRKLLSNIVDNPFDHEFENELLDDHYDSRDDGDVIDEIIQEEEEDILVEPDIVIEEAVIVEQEEEKPKKRGRKADDKAKYYVEPKKFDEEIMNYYSSGKMSNELADMISKISHKLSYAPNFINYSYREEMVGDGVIRMMKALIAKKYNREKGTNPFSYFTRIAFNAFRNRIKKEKHIHETHEKYQKEIMFMSEQIHSLSKNNNIRLMKQKYGEI
jgi:hypothetical protein